MYPCEQPERHHTHTHTHIESPCLGNCVHGDSITTQKCQHRHVALRDHDEAVDHQAEADGEIDGHVTPQHALERPHTRGPRDGDVADDIEEAGAEDPPVQNGS
jgi:hypothetical protein